MRSREERKASGVLIVREREKSISETANSHPLVVERQTLRFPCDGDRETL